MQTWGLGSLETAEPGRMDTRGNLQGRRGESLDHVSLLSLLSVGTFSWAVPENFPAHQMPQVLSGEPAEALESGETHLDVISRRWTSRVSRPGVQCSLLVPLLFPRVGPRPVPGSLGRTGPVLWKMTVKATRRDE